MSDEDDPFAEPGDTDRTVIKPNPAGRLTSARAAEGQQQVPPAAQPVAEPAEQQPRLAGEDAAVSLAMTGMNQLNASASTLFALISRIRNRAQHLDPGNLRRNVVAEIREFESRAQKLGIDPQTVKLARYAICATIDDVVLNTPWGGESIWAQQTMVGTFHKETVGGDRFYDLLAKLEKDYSSDVSLLEFLYTCLALGFEGRLRVDPQGTEKHMRIRAGLAKRIREQRGMVESELSPHWRGVIKEIRNFSIWTPVWVCLGALAAVLAVVFMGLSWSLAGTTENVRGQLSALEAGAIPVLERRAPPPPPPPPPPPEQDIKEKVRKFLEAEIREGIVEVFDDANIVTVRFVGKGMFPSGSDQLETKFVQPVIRVGNALNDEPGPIIVAGHSDNIPINTARFPSNSHLSLARAQSVMKTMILAVSEPRRLSAEGRADKQPIESNATAEGRAANRRIEIILVKQTGE